MGSASVIEQLKQEWEFGEWKNRVVTFFNFVEQEH